MSETPTYDAVLQAFAERARAAELVAVGLDRLLGDIADLHRSDPGAACPACGLPGPCPTAQLATGQADLDGARHMLLRVSPREPGAGPR